MKKILLYILLVIFGYTSLGKASSLKENYINVSTIALPVMALSKAIYLQDKEGIKQFIAAYSATMLTTYGARYTAARVSNNHTKFSPSPDIASSFSSSFFLWQRYSWQVGLPATAMAAIQSSFEIHLNHYNTSEALAGATITGIYSYFLVTKYKGLASHLNLTYSSQNKLIGISYQATL